MQSISFGKFWILAIFVVDYVQANHVSDYFSSMNLNRGWNFGGNILNNFPWNRRTTQQFRNGECETNLGTLGVCMRSYECTRQFGQSVGYCSNHKVCCLVSLPSGGSSNAKKVSISGSVQSTQSVTSSSYTINRHSPYVCQLRVDFSTSLPQPSNYPNDPIPGPMPTCINSFLSLNSMQFCGVNNNQHVYIPFGPSMSSQQIHIMVGANNFATWKLTVTQLECPPSSDSSNIYSDQQPGHLIDLPNLLKPRIFDVDLIAPSGCLQYFPNSTGTFESFNYNNGQGPYMANMKYAICFNRPIGATALQLYAERFFMSHNNDELSLEKLDGDCHDESSSTQIFANDYLLIPYSSIIQTGQGATRYCGDILEGKNLIAIPPGPFSVLVNSGNIYLPAALTDSMDRAFKVAFVVV